MKRLVVLSFCFLDPTFIFAREQDLQQQPTEEIVETPLVPFFIRSFDWPHEEHEVHSTHLLPDINSTAGVSARGSEGSPTISIRGSVSASRVLALYNGIPLNMNDGLGPALLLVPEENIHLLDFLKGPASLYYGSHAMGGIVQYRTKRHSRPQIRFEQASFGESSALFATPFSNSQATLFLKDREGSFPYELPDGTRGIRTANEDRLQRLSLDSFQSFGSTDLREDLLLVHQLRSSSGSLSFPSVNRTERHGLLAGLSGTTHLNSSSDLNFQGSHLLHLVSSDDEMFGAYEGRSSQWHSTLGLSTLWNESLQMEFFVDANHDQYITQEGPSLSSSYVEPGISFSVELFEQTEIQGGARMIDRSSQWTPSILVSSNLGTHQYWFSYARGYHLPSLSDLWGESAQFVGNPNLKAESSSQFEVGHCFPSLACKGFGKSRNVFEVFHRTSLFYTHYDDQILSQINDKGIYTRKNLASSHATGVDYQFSAKWNHWKIETTAGLMATRDHSNLRPLPLSPEGQLSVSIARQWQTAQALLKATTWGKYYDGEFVSLSPWTTVDLIWSDQGHLNGEWEWSLGIENLMDTPRQLTLGYPEPQRRFFASIARMF